WLRSIFGPKLKLYPRPARKHAPQREPLSLFLDTFDGIDEGWSDMPVGPAAPAAPIRPAAPPRELSAPPPATDAVEAGAHLAVPDSEGVLAAEARDLLPGALADLH